MRYELLQENRGKSQTNKSPALQGETSSVGILSEMLLISACEWFKQSTFTGHMRRSKMPLRITLLSCRCFRLRLTVALKGWTECKNHDANLCFFAVALLFMVWVLHFESTLQAHCRDYFLDQFPNLWYEWIIHTSKNKHRWARFKNARTPFLIKTDFTEYLH